jgi:ATP-dependent DNA helicase RecQ
VGDVDHNIYAFNGASVRFIRQFEADYDARPTFLIENYRSTGHIVGASNAVIAPGVGRMKVEHPIEVNRARQREAHGGVWAQRDNVAQGRVQLLAVRNLHDELEIGQAAVLMGEFERLRQIDGDWQWSDCAVIAREWRYLDAVRAWCELHQVPVQVANEDSINVWRLRETQELVKWVRAKSAKQLDLSDLSAWIAGHESNTWWQLLNEAIDAYRIEVSGQEFPGTHLVDWLAEWGREVRRKQTGILLLTAHRAKGLEFRHVGVIDGGWDHDGRGSDPDETRRLFYVAMTRAKQTLVLVQVGARHRYSRELEANSHVQQREVHAGAMAMEYGRRFVIPSLREIDIGYAGRFSPSHRVHREIAGLRVGDPVELAHAHGKWVLMAQNGFEVGRMSRAFEQPRGKHFVSAKVLAIQSRNIGMVDDEFKKLVKVDEWEVVLPELVFA